MSHRFYYPAPLPNITNEFTLPDDVFHHALNVLRLRLNDTFELFDGAGSVATVQLSQIEKKRASAIVNTIQQHSIESPLSITLAQCLSVGDKMDWTIEKATELGVTRIVPLFSTKSLVKLTAERADKKIAHWQRIITAACAQSGRNKLPQLHETQSLKSFLSEQKNSDHYKLMLHPNGATPFKTLSRPTSCQEIIILIGPESGFDQSELTMAQTCGFTNTVLGPRILRTESAGLATIASIQVLWGDF